MGRKRSEAIGPLCALCAGCCVLWLFAFWSFAWIATRERDPFAFDLMRWELTRLPRKYVYQLGARLRGETRIDNQALAQYFVLLRSHPDNVTSEAADPGAGAKRLRPRAEARLESALADVIGRAGLATPLPSFLPGSVVRPPVDISFDDTPYVLVIGRRDKIELVRTEVLRPDLTAGEIEGIERAHTTGNQVALVERLGGFAAYPAVVRAAAGPREAAAVAAHEWVHHYLAFYPLGATYGTSPAMTSINETAADIISRELAGPLISRLNLTAVDWPSQPAGDFGQTLRELRIEVDTLLARGEIDAAETRMEAVRVRLAAEGVHIRRLNQAYLAFRNVYGGSPGARNPIGPALQRLRAASPDLRTFVETVRGFDDAADLDAALGLPTGAITGTR